MFSVDVTKRSFDCLTALEDMEICKFFFSRVKVNREKI